MADLALVTLRAFINQQEKYASYSLRISKLLMIFWIPHPRSQIHDNHETAADIGSSKAHSW